MRIIEENQPSGAECFEMHVSLTSKYGCRMSSAVSDVYSYSFGLHRHLMKKSDHNDKLFEY